MMPKTGAKKISILFVGNSFSYYHALPKLITLFAKTSGWGEVFTDGIFQGGATLKVLWERKGTRRKLESKTWDYIVLQERGRLGGVVAKDGIAHVGNSKEFLKYAAAFDNVARQNGAKTVLYCPPSFIGLGLVNDAERLDTAYVAVGRRLGAKVVRSGNAFLTAMKARPGIDLFERDKHHPNPLGTYLIAALFFNKLSSKKKFDTPKASYISRSAKIPRTPKKISVSAADARFLWSIAERSR